MVVQVLSAEKPPVPYRAVGMSILLLAGTASLAVFMTADRSRDGQGPRVSPSGWAISYQYPRRLDQMQRALTTLGPAYMYSGTTRDAAGVLLIAHRILDAKELDLTSLCEELLAAPPWPHVLAVEPRRQVRTNVKLGPFDAVEVVDRRQGGIVRAAVTTQREAYALVFWLDAPPLGGPELRMFQLICASVESQSN